MNPFQIQNTMGKRKFFILWPILDGQKLKLLEFNSINHCCFDNVIKMDWNWSFKWNKMKQENERECVEINLLFSFFFFGSLILFFLLLFYAFTTYHVNDFTNVTCEVMIYYIQKFLFEITHKLEIHKLFKIHS